MLYRVAHQVNEELRTAEVEASSPHEAVVKFNHISHDRHRGSQNAKVLSVFMEPVLAEE